MSRRGRPLWRTGLDALAVIALMMLALGVMEFLPGNNLAGNMRVIDGDSLRPADELHDIRLQGIDAPEIGQRCRDKAGRDYDCGRKARAHLKAIVAGRDVRCRTMDVDRYQRSISICHAGDTELNRQMVADGWAVAYRLPAYVEPERGAKTAGIGLWQGEFDEPENWRRLNRSDSAGTAREPD
ncbi:MAG: thermonuclease family protein [Anderseniella sp.]